MYKNYQYLKKNCLFDFWLKLKNKGGVEFFGWREEFHNAGQIFTPDMGQIQCLQIAIQITELVFTMKYKSIELDIS